MEEGLEKKIDAMERERWVRGCVSCFSKVKGKLKVFTSN
jgi:hypothetical protein